MCARLIRISRVKIITREMFGKTYSNINTVLKDHHFGDVGVCGGGGGGGSFFFFFVNQSRNYPDKVIIVYLHDSITIMAVIKSYYCNVSNIILFVRPKSSCFDNEPCILFSTDF